MKYKSVFGQVKPSFDLPSTNEDLIWDEEAKKGILSRTDSPAVELKANNMGILKLKLNFVLGEDDASGSPFSPSKFFDSAHPRSKTIKQNKG